MTLAHPNRRNILFGAAALAATASFPVLAASPNQMHVLKDPSCGCCGSWVKTMKIAGFDVSVENVPNETLYQHKQRSGITEDLASCHTATIDGYLIEGHVPAADVKRLLETRPDALGLAVPGMPYGAPGMGPEDEREAYDVILFRADGSTEIFARYAAA
ncbi:DUF411 domain-containing protein [Shimia biformata]|uniref:DUF411 domain-containing protein n=1 Tax=Shimia biformata TaxID=1294299 RepID=UPI001951C754|nr:DUF411 domain-containing protein [Shimia biformata]